MGETNGIAWLEDDEMILEPCPPQVAYEMWQDDQISAMYIKKGIYYYPVRDLQIKDNKAYINLSRWKRDKYVYLRSGNIYAEIWDPGVRSYESCKDKIIKVGQIIS